MLPLPGCGHFYVENMHLLPWPGAIEHLWSNLAFKRAIIAWTKAVYTGDLSALAGCQSDVSPHISLPTYLIGLGSGGTIAYQIAVSETPASFRACVCGLPFGCLMRLCLCADIYLGGRSCKPG